jgi:hypothetical protein
MALGEDGDFRMVGFRQIMRFPSQDILGGPGSVLGRDFTTPFGGNLQQPGSWTTNNFYSGDNFNQYVNNSFNNQNVNNNVTNNYNYSCGECGGGGGGTITVVGDDGTGVIQTYTNIDTLEFVGTALNSVTATGSTAEVEYNSGGGPGGSTSLVYGKITAATRITTGIARWEYTISLYSGGSVTAYNLFEYENTNAIAYGLSIVPAGTDQISGTSFAIRPVPDDTWVALDNTDGVNGTTDYWFAAPNVIIGSCA